MAMLTSKLVISLVDQVSGPARRMLAQIKALQTAGRTAPMAALATEGKRFGAATQRFSAAVSTPLGIGMAALIQSTQEFEKALVGVQIAGIADNLKDGSVNFGKLRSEAEATRQEAMRLSEALRLRPDGLLKAGEAAAKMGLSADKLGALMKMAGAINIQDGSLSPEHAAEFMGSMGILFNAGKNDFDGGTGTGDYTADITKLSNQLLGVANMTRTGAGRLQEGLRQFAPLYASFGETFASASAMIGAMVQAGQLDVESGTALKSLGVRMLKPTGQGREAMLKAGIDRSQFMDLSGVSAGQAFNALMKLTDANLKKDQRAAIKKKLIEGETGKKFLDENWQQELLRLYNSATGAETAEAREANMERVMMSIMTGGGRIKMFDLMKTLGEKMETGELTDAQMAMIGEGRHLSKYKALFKMLPFMQELYDKIEGINSEFTDAGTKLWGDSSAGRWEGALASMQRAFIRLRESEGITRLIDSLSRLGEAIAKAPAGAVEALGKALVGLAIIGPVGLALSGTASAISMVGSAARLALIPVAGLLSRLWSLGRASAVVRGAAVSGAAALAEVPLFSMRKHTPASKTAKAAASSRMISGMGTNAQASQRMVLGMSTVGQAAAATPPGIGARLMSMAAGLGRVAALAGRLTLVGAAIGAIVFAVQNASGIAEMFASIGTGLSANLGPEAKQMLDDIGSAFSGVANWFGEITGLLNVGTGQWKSWGENIGHALAWPLNKLGELYNKLKDIYSYLRDSTIAKFFFGERKPDTPNPVEQAPGQKPVSSPAPTGGAAAATRIDLAPKPVAQSPGQAPSPAMTGGPSSSSADLTAVGGQAQTIVVSVGSAMDQVRSIVSKTVGEMRSFGEQAAQNFADGFRARTPAIVEATSSAMGAASRNALKGTFTDGGR